MYSDILGKNQKSLYNIYNKLHIIFKVRIFSELEIFQNPNFIHNF